MPETSFIILNRTKKEPRAEGMRQKLKVQFLNFLINPRIKKK